MTAPQVITLGCRLNLAESEAIAARIAGEPGLIVVNSCAVTAQAVRDTRAAIRNAARETPDARILVTGCAAEIDPETFRAMPEVAGIIPQAAKTSEHLLSTLTPFVLSEVEGRATSESLVARASTSWRSHEVYPERLPSQAVEGLSTNEGVEANMGRARALVPVQTGCDHDCTFCIIPKGRGPSRSVPAGAVIDRIAALVDQGHREIVLTGVDLTSYGADLPGAPTLGLLVERILRLVPALARLRLSSLDSVEIDDRLFDLVTGEARVMPHLHLSLQAGDDMVLKRMKRRHSRRQSVEMVARLKARRPDIAIGADLIAGFPTESEDMAANTLALIEDCDIVHPHIFPYSPRAGTPAARMPQVAGDRIKARARALRDAGAARRLAWLTGLVGSDQRVLVERGGTGHTEGFATVALPVIPAKAGIHGQPDAAGASVPPSTDSRVRGNDGWPVGTVVPLRITGLAGTNLTAVAA